MKEGRILRNGSKRGFGAALLGLLKLACGVDNVPIVSDVPSESQAGAAGETSNADGVGQASGGAASGGSAGNDHAGMAGASASAESIQFFACRSDSESIEVRGVGRQGCWLVVLAHDRRPGDRCHPEVESSNGWCVVEVGFSETRDECSRGSGTDDNNYMSSGSLEVSDDFTLTLDLDFSIPELDWKSDVPFAVAGCLPNCGSDDCRR